MFCLLFIAYRFLAIAKTGKMPVPQPKQARCLFHNPNRQDACSTTQTGKMPVPQDLKFLVGWASCPPMQDVI
jgi:hypothetical protein